MIFRTLFIVLFMGMTCANATADTVSQVYLAALDTSELVIESPSTSVSARGRTFDLTDDEVQGMKDLFARQVANAFASSKAVALTDDPTLADIYVLPSLLKLTPSAPKDDLKNRNAFDRYVSRGAGSATIEFQLITSDSTTAVLEDRRDAGHQWRENVRFNNKREVKRLFADWGRLLVDEANKLGV